MHEVTVDGVALDSMMVTISDPSGLGRVDTNRPVPEQDESMDDDDTAGFRRVLHEWAARHLTADSGHVGPFEVVHVELDHDLGSSISGETTSVFIQFRHDGRACPEDWRVTGAYTPAGKIELRERCVERSWFMPDTRRTVDMVNELLTIADETPTPS